jgi:hypothetical protein
MTEYQTVAGSESSALVPHEPRTIRSEALMMSEIGDGVFVQWGDCAACGQRVTGCRCATGPVEPAHIKRWREGRFDPEIRIRIPVEERQEHNDTEALQRTAAETHSPCPDHPGQWFNKSTGDCSCGGNHRVANPLDARPNGDNGEQLPTSEEDPDEPQP